MTFERLVPKPLHILALRTVHALRLRWWRWVKPSGRGVRVVVIDPAERVLLIRHSYGSDRWMLPGGGYGRGEDVVSAAAREALEETGCRIADPVEIGDAREVEHGAGNRFVVVAGWSEDTPVPDGREVLDARFFALDALPEPLAGKLAISLPRYLTAAKAARPRPAGAAVPPPPATTA